MDSIRRPPVSGRIDPISPTDIGRAAQAKPKSHLTHFDYFRGITILLVIWGHCCTEWVIDNVPEVMLVNLITGSTAVFVFISGFFFQHVFVPRYNYGAFILSKAKNVAAPYLFLSVLSLAFYQIVFGELPYASYFAQTYGAGDIGAWGWNIALGRSWASYWYIPFVLLIFMLSPVFLGFARLSGGWQIAVTLAALALAPVAQRPAHNLNPFHSVIYFVGFYMMGIHFAKYRTQWEPWLRRLTLPALITTVAIAYWMGVLDQVQNATKPSLWTWAGFDLMVPLKVVTILGLLGLCLHLSAFQLGPLRHVAEVSFGLFFLHVAIVILLDAPLPAGINDTALAAFLRFLWATAISLVLIQVIKRLAGRRSRYLIGC